MPIRIVHFGLGPIGSAIVRDIAGRRGFTIAGGIDIDPAKAGRDLGDVAGVGRRLGVRVAPEARTVLKTVAPDVVVLCTSSSLRRVLPQIETVLKARVPIVSTIEELAYPAGPNRTLGRRIDELARRSKVAVLSTGVNPGFAMDTLPIALTGVCERVDSILVERVQDARMRRRPFQEKIGAGLSREQFEQKVADGTVRHVGLRESVTMIADALGWKLDRITDEIGPRLADDAIDGGFVTVNRGDVCGIVQEGVGFRKGVPVIRLHLEAYLGAAHPYDAVRIDGSPPLKMRIEGGIPGDIATSAIVINSIPKVLAAPPGLRTMRDLPIPSCFSGGRAPRLERRRR